MPKWRASCIKSPAPTAIKTRRPIPIKNLRAILSKGVTEVDYEAQIGQEVETNNIIQDSNGNIFLAEDSNDKS